MVNAHGRINKMDMPKTAFMTDHEIKNIQYAFAHIEMPFEKRKELMARVKDLVDHKVSLPHKEFLKEKRNNFNADSGNN